MWERLRRFNALERPAQSLFLSAIVLLPLVCLSLRWRGFRATQKGMQRLLSRPLTPTFSSWNMARAALTARMVHAAARHSLGHPSCLEESLAVWWLLGRQAMTSQLRIGIRKDGGKFEAHAWVERDGIALNEPEGHHQHYAPFEKEFSALPPEAS